MYWWPTHVLWCWYYDHYMPYLQKNCIWKLHFICLVLALCSGNIVIVMQTGLKVLQVGNNFLWQEINSFSRKPILRGDSFLWQEISPLTSNHFLQQEINSLRGNHFFQRRHLFESDIIPLILNCLFLMIKKVGAELCQAQTQLS